MPRAARGLGTLVSSLLLPETPQLNRHQHALRPAHPQVLLPPSSPPPLLFVSESCFQPDLQRNKKNARGARVQAQRRVVEAELLERRQGGVGLAGEQRERFNAIQQEAKTFFEPFWRKKPRAALAEF